MKNSYSLILALLCLAVLLALSGVNVWSSMVFPVLARITGDFILKEEEREKVRVFFTVIHTRFCSIAKEVRGIISTTSRYLFKWSILFLRWLKKVIAKPPCYVAGAFRRITAKSGEKSDEKRDNMHHSTSSPVGEQISCATSATASQEAVEEPSATTTAK